MQPVLADERMSDVDALVWAVESEPRLRTTIAALAIFDRPIDRAELRHRIDRASRVIPRLRQRVVPDPNPICSPRWSIDPGFDLDRHFRVAQLDTGDNQTLTGLVRDLMVQPFDRTIPLWEFTLIENTTIQGTPDAGCAVLLKTHHAVSDGVGGVAMMLELFDLEATPPADRSKLPPAPTGAADPGSGANALVGEARRLFESLAVPHAIDDLVKVARIAGEAVGSATRLFRPPNCAALPRERSAALDLRFFAVSLADLKSAGGRIAGTVNDAFVGAISIALSDYLQADGDATARVSIPINTRPITTPAGGNTPGGNQWTPGRIDLTLDRRRDPDIVAEDVQAAMHALRREPAHLLVHPLAGALRRLPPPVLGAAARSLIEGLDLAASNIPGSPMPLHLCGEEVRGLVPFGPLSGCAANITLLSHAGQAHIGISTDPAAIVDPDSFAQHLETGFAAMIKGS